jgi:hypothetical protein
MIIVGRGLATASIRCLVARVQVLELVLSLKQVKNVSILISDLNDLGGEELSAWIQTQSAKFFTGEYLLSRCLDVHVLLYQEVLNNILIAFLQGLKLFEIDLNRFCGCFIWGIIIIIFNI